MKRYLSLFICLLVLAGCSEKPKTFQYFMAHPEVIQTVLNHCQLQGEKAASDQQCIAANQAADHLRDLFLQFKQNTQKFGETIIKTQMEIVAAQKLLDETDQKLKEAKKQDQQNVIVKLSKEAEQSQQQLQTLQDQYAQYMSVIRMQGI